MMTIFIESGLICLLFSWVVVKGAKQNPLSGLHNLPLKIQERVAGIEAYQNIKILSVKQRIVKKIPALIVVFFIFCLLVYFAGADSFTKDFCYAFILWGIVKIYAVVVLNCFWYAHHPQYWIKGTEDLKAEYQNYAFYFKSIPRSLAAGGLVAVLIGLVIMLDVQLEKLSFFVKNVLPSILLSCIIRST